MKRILHPKKWVLSAISLVSYTTLILIFVYGKTECVGISDLLYVGILSCCF